MRTHRRDDLRKSHLAFPDERVKSIRSVLSLRSVGPSLLSSLSTDCDATAFRHKFAYFCRFRTLRGAEVTFRPERDLRSEIGV